MTAAQAGAQVGPCQPDFCQDEQAVCWFQHSHQLSVQLGPAPVFQTLLTPAFLQGESLAQRGPHGHRQDYLPFKRERKRKHPLGSDLGHHIFWHPQWKGHPVQQLRTCGQERNVQGKSRSSY